MPGNDPVGVALASIGAGATAGGAAIAAGLFFLRAAGSPPGAFGLVAASLAAGVVLSVALAWHLTRSITDWYRRGVSAAVATFAAFMLGAATAPIDMVAGRIGLATWSLLLLGAAVYCVTRARRFEAAE